MDRRGFLSLFVAPLLPLGLSAAPREPLARPGRRSRRRRGDMVLYLAPPGWGPAAVPHAAELFRAYMHRGARTVPPEQVVAILRAARARAISSRVT